MNTIHPIEGFRRWKVPARWLDSPLSATILACSLVIAVVSKTQSQLASIGLYYDDYLVYRHYALVDVLRSFWTNIAEVTSDQLWIPAYRPMTLVAHATTYELFGFEPEKLLACRVMLQVTIGILVMWWTRLLGLKLWIACFCSMVFLLFPMNFQVFLWNTEIGAVSGIIWFLLSLILHTKGIQREAIGTSGCRIFLVAYVFWTLSLLTKEVVVPVIVIFPLLDIFYRYQTAFMKSLRLNGPYFLILVLYLMVRTVALQGKWGGQGVSPDTMSLSSFAVSAIFNYGLFLHSISLANTIVLVHPHSPLPAFFVSMPFGVLAFIGVACVHRKWIESATTIVFPTEPLRYFTALPTEFKCIYTGLALLFFGGTICCFFVDDRIAYITTLGFALVVAAAVQFAAIHFHLWQSKLGISLTVFFCLVYVLAEKRLYHQRALSSRSPFVLSAEQHDLEAYFAFAHLFQRWDAKPQAFYLRNKLYSLGLIDDTGRPNDEVISRVLAEKGHAMVRIQPFIDSLKHRVGALELFTANAPINGESAVKLR